MIEMAIVEAIKTDKLHFVSTKETQINTGSPVTPHQILYIHHLLEHC